MAFLKPTMGGLFSPTATGCVLPHLLLPAAQIFALALPPFRYRAHIFVPIIFSLIYATWANLCTEALDIRIFLISQWPWYLGTLEKLISPSIPEEKYWRSDKPQTEAMDPNMTLMSKWKWSAAMYCSPRGIGWNYQAKGVPGYKAPDTKTKFFIEQGKRLLFYFIMLDACNMWVLRKRLYAQR